MADSNPSWSSISKLKFNPQYYSSNFQLPGYSYTPAASYTTDSITTPPSTDSIVSATTQSIPSTQQATDKVVSNWEALTEKVLKPTIDYQYQSQLAFNAAQMQQSYPWLSQAAAEATARNLAASKSFYAFKQQSPSAVQDIMASKQSQIASASDAEYRRALGMAAQQQAAKDFVGRYIGQTFQTA